jgi:SAM-dependent methyltransferase
MTITEIERADHGNLQKHLNPNKVQQWLIERFHRRVAALIKQTEAPRLLDAGCGEGFGLSHLLDEGIDAAYVGCDLSWPALQWGRQNLLPDLSASVADLYHLPFADDSFPLVICLEVLEHLPDSKVGLRELARVSQEYLIVSVPHEPFFRGANFLRGKHLAQWGNDPEHLHNYNGRAFRRMVSGVVDILWHGYSFPWQMALARKRPANG